MSHFPSPSDAARTMQGDKDGAPTPVFELDHGKLASDPRFAEIARGLTVLAPIESQQTFNRYCAEACRIWSERFVDKLERTSDAFANLIARVERGDPDTIRTGWGGVVITLHEHPRVEKYLVIRQGGFLALEMHEQKDEHLRVEEGAGLILWRSAPGAALLVEALLPGKTFHFAPGREHCLIGSENLLVFEQSRDPKGMDQDLIFIYEPERST